MGLSRAAGRVCVVTAIVWAAACDRESPAQPSPSPAPTAISEAARTYLEAILEIAEREAVHKATIDWPAVRSEVFATAGTAQTVRDTHPAIGALLRSLKDHESLYISAAGLRIGGSGAACAQAGAFVQPLPATVGYLNVPGCNCDDDAANRYAEAMHQTIRDRDRPDLDGWIVDLRQNDGGNMWPMLAGAGPLIGEGIVGYIVYNDQEYEREYRDGRATSFGDTFAMVISPYVPIKPNPRIAVLTSGRTISAGEAMVVWFKGRPDTRSFGQPTCGHHHLLEEFQLRDGARLVLVTAVHHDRTRRTWEGSMPPDEIVSGQAELARRAIEWIQTGR